VRWSDESNKRYLMLASDCLPRALVDEEQCVLTGDCLCGQAQARAATRVIPIQGEGHSALLGHCARAGYETVISVPVRLHERLVGELDLFYRAPRQLSGDDRTLLETIASHLAGAIEGLRAAALQRETAVAEERGFIARELHDSIAQGLAFLKIQLGLLRNDLKSEDAVRIETTLRELDTGVHESLSDVRELLVHFRTRTNDEDIVPALKTTLQKFEHQTGLATHLEIEGDGLPLPADAQVHVLHVVQEALSNVRKHAVRCGSRCSSHRNGALKFATTVAASLPVAPSPMRPTSACASCASARSTSAPPSRWSPFAGRAPASC
jgi:two-component system nitrate/nitrite sensor histidine kinase NarX